MNSKGLLLLVEDDEDDEELTLRALEQHGIGGEVVVARDGADAIGRGRDAKRRRAHSSSP